MTTKHIGTTKHMGTCFCGTVQIEVAGEP